ncbi:class I SAM-dependent methyltransferase [Methylocystis heyeri]|uniref:Methyltransferase domain-containing protein n=1 Tax=Methylocystis heyeri TaxID=391905 RepID=A0A6B8KKF8_9HYPH|nr:class I SAM-dependent methyltransferase [Methylocystis heyeri]QGM47138.1 methyltransferase domain-containing protein [Methylocystis heyeri]
MAPFQFDVKPHNAHYDTSYSSKMIQWRQFGAKEKSGNIAHILTNNAKSKSGDIRDENVSQGKILEVGCGTGIVLQELKNIGIGREFHGIDVIDLDRNRDVGEDIRLLQYDGDAIPFEDRNFDFTYATHVIEHIDNPRALIKEMSRVTKGLMYFEVPCELHARTTYNDLQKTLNIGHINAYTPESFSLLLQTCGLEVIGLEIFDHTLEVHSFYCGRMRGMAKMAIRRGALALNPYLASRIFSYHCGALVRRSS